MRFNVLDIMRFSAALIVVLYHYTSGTGSEPFVLVSWLTQYGYLGVPLFFMISGFVISASALHRTPAEFAISRGTRLYPTVFACLTITTLFIQFLGEGGISIVQYLTNLTILNLYVGQEFVDGVYWTLLAELKFYACVFVLLAVGVFAKFKIWLTAWMLLTISFLLFDQPSFMGIFISPEYSAFFIAGIAFYIVTKQGYDSYYVGLLYTAFVVGSINIYEQAPGFMKNTDQLDQIISVILVGFFFGLFFLISKDKIQIRKSKTLMLLGGMTYPLYLLHSMIGKVLFEKMDGAIQPYISVLLVTLLMLIMSYWIHVIVEKRWANSIKDYLFGLLANFRSRTGKLTES